MQRADSVRLAGARASWQEPLGPWTGLHTFGAAVVLVIAFGLAGTMWLGWPLVRSWLVG